MAVSVVVYNLFKTKLLSQADAIDFDTATIKVALCTSSYTPDYDAHNFYDDLTNELAGTGGYTAGGATLASPVTGTDTSGNFGYFDAADLTWTTLTPSAAFRYGAVYKSTGVAGTSPLIMLIDFGGNTDPAGLDFTLQFAAPASGGVLKVA